MVYAIPFSCISEEGTMDRIVVIIIEKGPVSWKASSPLIPEHVVEGDTREEVEQLMREAVQAHLQELHRLQNEAMEAAIREARIRSVTEEIAKARQKGKKEKARSLEKLLQEMQTGKED
jgi:predicted RNase H-like HicB family nuclease